MIYKKRKKRRVKYIALPASLPSGLNNVKAVSIIGTLKSTQWLPFDSVTTYAIICRQDWSLSKLSKMMNVQAVQRHFRKMRAIDRIRETNVS